MGAETSSPTSTPSISASFMPLTLWLDGDIEKMKERYDRMGNPYSLTRETFEELFFPNPDPRKSPPEDSVAAAHGCFKAFDTDSNGIVDALECLCGVILVTAMKMNEKRDIVFSLFDFSGTNRISGDELIILLRLAIGGLAKIDGSVKLPPMKEMVKVARTALKRAEKDPEGELSKREFDALCTDHELIRQFLVYIDGCAGHAHVQPGSAWKDKDFPLDKETTYNQQSERSDFIPLVWPSLHSRRNWDIAKDFIDGNKECLIPSHDVPVCTVRSGALGDSWLRNAIEILSAQPSLIRRLFVTTGQEHVGRYCLRFYKNAEWKLVYVDGMIPCTLGETPAFTRGDESNWIDSFTWVSVVEKALAKLHGSYEALTGLHDVASGLEDLTGGIAAVFTMNEIAGVGKDKVVEGEDATVAVYEWLKSEHMRGVVGAMLCTGASATEDGLIHHHQRTSIKARRGVATGQAYSVRGVRIAKEGILKGNRVVRMRVPNASLHLFDPSHRTDRRGYCMYRPRQGGSRPMSWCGP